MFKVKFSDFKINPYWLKNKKFWLFFTVQFFLWFGFYFWQVREIFDIIFFNAGQPVLSFEFHLLNSFLVGLPIFIIQIFSAALLPKIKFWQVASTVILCYFERLGLFVALVYFLLERFNPKKITEKFFVSILALILFSVVIIFFTILNLFLVNEVYNFFLF